MLSVRVFISDLETIVLISTDDDCTVPPKEPRRKDRTLRFATMYKCLSDMVALNSKYKNKIHEKFTNLVKFAEQKCVCVCLCKNPQSQIK